MLKIETLIKSAETRSLSDREIMRNDQDIIVIGYHEILKNINQIIENLMNGYKYIIRYEFASTNTGHYVALFLNRSNITFYDSLGFAPDYEVKNELTEHNLIDHVIQQMKTSGYNTVDINYFRHQSMKNSVNTCGRHTMIRCLMYELDNNQYNNFIRSSKYNPDELVTMMTMLSSLSDFTLN